eukprot:6259176-Amphidinium_carterae.1
MYRLWARYSRKYGQQQEQNHLQQSLQQPQQQEATKADELTTVFDEDGWSDISVQTNSSFHLGSNEESGGMSDPLPPRPHLHLSSPFFNLEPIQLNIATQNLRGLNKREHNGTTRPLYPIDIVSKYNASIPRDRFFFLKNKWISFVDKLYFGHSQVAALTLNSTPMPILLFSIYLPIAASNIEDKQESYDRMQLLLSNNPGAIPNLLGDFNTCIINNFDLEHHVGAQFFPSAYSLEDAPQDVTESRD